VRRRNGQDKLGLRWQAERDTALGGGERRSQVVRPRSKGAVVAALCQRTPSDRPDSPSWRAIGRRPVFYTEPMPGPTSITISRPDPAKGPAPPPTWDGYAKERPASIKTASVTPVAKTRPPINNKFKQF